MSAFSIGALAALGLAVAGMAAFAFARGGASGAGVTLTVALGALGAALAATGRTEIGAALLISAIIIGGLGFAMVGAAPTSPVKPVPLRWLAALAPTVACVVALAANHPSAPPPAVAPSSAPFAAAALLAAIAGVGLALVLAFGRGERSVHDSERRR
jgi:hypothetical protein